MTFALYIVVCAIFYLAFVKLRIVGRTAALFAVFGSARQVVLDRELNDEEKESRIRQAAIESLVGTLALSMRLLVIFVCAALPVLLVVQLTDMDIDTFLAFSLNPLVLVITVLALSCLHSIRRTKAS